ncbi:Zinc finger ccch domain-containing protein 14 [Plakobranchus ocellatus]|uniref:Zinc finger CCCH domain-containing protein 14 n=1 Tax=Plakobranchus ocellatus TaxID=259542 RepID=A0AAV4CNU0_9GAST|nr:Zinc finger ccch domain-containing protein 14 [Plakobranchus ocellatus]
MEVGTEISQKIRSAIKAKLMDLGAYVDDELPDYIMVMVANKKNKSQMKADLSLFLGSNTDTFTSWLHGLLGKLQTITVDSNKSKSGKSKVPKDKKKEKDAGGKSKDDSTKSKKSSREKSRKRKSSHGSIEDASKPKNALLQSTEGAEESEKDLPVEQPYSESKANESTVQHQSQHSYDNAKQPDKSELSMQVAEAESNCPNQTSKEAMHEEVEDVRQLLVATTPGDDLARELDAAVEEEIDNSYPSKKTSSLSQAKDMSNKVSKDKPTVSAPVSSREQPSKKKVPSSVVASVIREQDEEYDPFNPAVGSVASVVKVTSRKPSFPPSMQANRPALTGEDVSEAGGTEPKSSRDDAGAQSETEPVQLSKDTLRLVDMECVKSALSEVLEKFEVSRPLDEIGLFARSVEYSLRQLDHKVFVQARSLIQKLLDGFNSQSTSTKPGLSPAGRADTSNGEVSKDKTSSLDECRSAQYICSKLDNVADCPERIIFSSKSKKSPALTQTEKGSEHYRTFVSSILNSTSEKIDAGGTNLNENGNDVTTPSSSQEQGNLSTQPCVSSTKIEMEASRAVSSCNEGLKASASSPKLAQPSSSFSTSSLTVPLFQSRNSAKSFLSDPGFHRLRSQILVDSLHVRRLPDPASASSPMCLLRHACNRQGGDKEGGAALGDSSPQSHSPQHYSGEALKVLAKNLRVTIINRQAKGSQESSSGDDSSSDDDSDEDESTDEDDDVGGELDMDTNEKTEQETSSAANNLL